MRRVKQVIKRKKKNDETALPADSKQEVHAENQNDFQPEGKSVEQPELALEEQAAGEMPEGVAQDEGEDGEQPFSIDDELASLQTELDDIQAKAAEYLDGWQRARAEFANYKKRVQKEREDSKSFITASTSSRLSPRPNISPDFVGICSSNRLTLAKSSRVRR